MKVNVAVSGRFHFHNFVRFLHDQGTLNRFYYAHKISTDTNSLGVPADKLVNVWIKEYMLQAHLRIPGRPGVELAKPLYRLLWAYVVLRHWSQSDILHLMLHGGGEKLIRRAHEEGALVIGEPVNVHPDTQNDILNTEYERLGMPPKKRRSRAQNQILGEVAMADRLLVASNFVKRSFVENGYPTERIDVLPYGVDLDRFSPRSDRSENPGRFRVICVAGINIRKGIVDLLEAWKRCAPPNGELLLIGRISPEMREMLQRYDGLFNHIPFVPNRELRNYMTESAVFVLPSLEDGFGLVCSEAMACGLPAIVTTNTGAAEIIENDVDGYVVPIRSPDAIAEKLVKIYSDRDKAMQMGKNAAKKIGSLYDWKGYAKELVKLYRSVI